MAERPVRINRNPYGYARNRNGDGAIDEPPPPSPPPPGFGVDHADLMVIATIVATTFQGLINLNANQPPSSPPPQNEIKYHESLQRNRARPSMETLTQRLVIIDSNKLKLNFNFN